MRSVVLGSFFAVACAACFPARHHCHRPDPGVIIAAGVVGALVDTAASSSDRPKREYREDYVCKHNPECLPPEDPYCADAPDGCCPCD